MLNEGRNDRMMMEGRQEGMEDGRRNEGTNLGRNGCRGQAGNMGRMQEGRKGERKKGVVQSKTQKIANAKIRCCVFEFGLSAYHPSSLPPPIHHFLLFCHSPPPSLGGGRRAKKGRGAWGYSVTEYFDPPFLLPSYTPIRTTFLGRKGVLSG